jgi:hypothetical protein
MHLNFIVVTCTPNICIVSHQAGYAAPEMKMERMEYQCLMEFPVDVVLEGVVKVKERLRCVSLPVSV